MRDDFLTTMDAVSAAATEAQHGAAPPPPAPDAPAAPSAPAAPPAAAPPGIEDGDLLYRDAKALREDITRTRERFRPLEEAFGGWDDDARAQILAAAPALGSELAEYGQVLAAMHPDDRAEMLDLLGQLRTEGGDIDAVADRFAEISEGLRTRTSVTAPPEPARAGNGQFEAGAGDGDDVPITRGEMRQMMADQEQSRADEAAVGEIMAEVRALGYDPDSSEPIERARFTGLLEVARMDPDGSIQNAHQAMLGWEQKIRDDYASGKSADADRPLPTSGAGNSPTQERVLESLDDADAAMNARLDAALGPRR